MRIVSYIFLVIVTVFLTNAAVSFVSPGYRTILHDAKVRLTGEQAETEKQNATDKRLVDSLDRIDQSIQSLSSTGNTVVTPTPVVVASGTTLSGATVPVAPTPVVASPPAPVEPDVSVSGMFLAKIMPEITLKKIDNSGIFNIFIFNKIEYTSYQDEKKRIKVYAFAPNYDTMLANLKLTSSVYAINETDQFFGYTFFLNPVKKDDTIRFVTSLEGHAIGVEVSKKYYPTLKKMLLKP